MYLVNDVKFKGNFLGQSFQPTILNGWSKGQYYLMPSIWVLIAQDITMYMHFLWTPLVDS